MLDVTDDSGFLALVVPATYDSFVASDWTFDQILGHFQKEMARGSLLIWGTGLEGLWNVDFLFNQTELAGFREVKGLLRVEGGSLLLTNYESLTMAAQFKDVMLPEKHQVDLLVRLPDDYYACRIIQMFDPKRHEAVADGKPDFVVEIQKATSTITSWRSIPWFDLDSKR